MSIRFQNNAGSQEFVQTNSTTKGSCGIVVGLEVVLTTVEQTKLPKLTQEEHGVVNSKT